MDIFKGSITNINIILCHIADCLDDVELISGTLTPIVPLVFPADPLSHPKSVSGNMTSSNILGNQEYDSSAGVVYFLSVRDNSANSFSLTGFGTSA